MSSDGPAVDLAGALERLAAFRRIGPLTSTIADLENRLVGAEADGVHSLARALGIDGELLRAALDVRRELGRINDLIHALAIVRVVEGVMEPGETMVNRPSLAAGNDPSRLHDVETDRRVAEFKLARWAGADAMRKRQTFKDLVHLAADDSGRRAELYVVGPRPLAFLRKSRSTAAWALDRFPVVREMYLARGWRLETSVADFTAGPGAHVALIDLEGLLPELTNPAP